MTRVFQRFFKLFGLRLGLRKAEIEAGANCLFLSLAQHNREEFEDWVWQEGEAFDDYCIRMRTEG